MKYWLLSKNVAIFKWILSKINKKKLIVHKFPVGQYVLHENTLKRVKTHHYNPQKDNRKS